MDVSNYTDNCTYRSNENILNQTYESITLCSMNNSDDSNVSSDSVISDVSDVTLYEDISKYLWIVLSPIFFLIGTTGNVLNIFVLKRMQFFKKPPYLFLFVLALSDITVLCVGLSRYWIRETFSFDLRTISSLGCKFNLFFIYWSMQFSSWILVCVVLERCIKTNFPLRYSSIVTIKRCVVLVVTVMVILAGVDLHYFWTNGLVPDGDDVDCTSLNEKYFEFEEFTFIYIDLTFLSIVPFVLMLIMNITIIRVIKKSRHFRRGTVSNQQTNVRMNRFDSKLTRMLIWTSFYFLAATVPISIYFIVDSYQNNLTDLETAKMDVVWSVCYIFQFSNYTVNFFLYNLTNVRFRKNFKAMFSCKLRPKRRTRFSNRSSVYSIQMTESTFTTQTSITRTNVDNAKSETSEE